MTLLYTRLFPLLHFRHGMRRLLGEDKMPSSRNIVFLNPFKRVLFMRFLATTAIKICVTLVGLWISVFTTSDIILQHWRMFHVLKNGSSGFCSTQYPMGNLKCDQIQQGVPSNQHNGVWHHEIFAF